MATDIAPSGPAPILGLMEPGNIDLNTRPVVKGPDGKIATVRSMSANYDGQEVLIPTVGDNGRVMTDQEALAAYESTGRHLGKFDSPENATLFAQSLHQEQDQQYSDNPEPLTGGNDLSAPYMVRRQLMEADASVDDLRRRVEARREQEAPQAAPAGDAPAKRTVGAIAGAVAKDVGTGARESVRQSVGGVADGINNAVQFLIDTTEPLAAWLENNVVALGQSGLTADDLKLPTADPAKSVTGGLIRNVSNFLTGFVPAMKAMKAVGVTGKVAGAMGAGAIADATVMDPFQERLANVWQQVGLPENVLTDYLAAKPDDTAAEGRLKNAVEGLGIGLLAEGLVMSVKAVRSAIRLKQEVSGADPAKLAEAQQKALYGEVSDADLAVFGDPNGPLTASAPPKVAAPAAAREVPKPLQGAERYEKIGQEDYVRFSNGTDVAVIDDGLAKAAGIEAGPIRLPKGHQDTNASGGRGEIHILAGHGAQLGMDPAEFVAKVATGFNEIRRDHKGQLFLIMRDPAKTGKKEGQDSLILFLQKSPGGGYDVVTGGSFKNNYLDNRELLWEGERLAPSSPTGLASPSSTSPVNAAGGAKLLSAGDQSNAGNVVPASTKGKVAASMAATGKVAPQDLVNRARAVMDFKPRTLSDMEAVDAAQGADGLTELLGILRGKVQLKGTSLTQFLVENGGLKNQGDEIKTILGNAGARPGLINRRGMNLDDAAHKAWEMGYMADFQERPSINDFLDVLREDVSKRSIRYGNTLDHRDLAAKDAAEELDRIMNEMDIDLKSSTDEDITRRLRSFVEEGDATPRTAGDMAAEAQAMEARGYYESQGPQSEVYINFARIASPDDIKSVMGQMADTFRGSIETARRGVQSNEETKKLADDLGMSVADILARRKGQPFNAEEALAARQMWAASADKLLTLARKASGANAGPVDQYNFRKMMGIHYAIQAEVIGARTETARALQAWAIPAGGDTEKARSIQMLMTSMGGPDASAQMAKRLTALADLGATPDAINTFARKGWGATSVDAIKEVWINGLLSSPKTHVVNVSSNLVVAMQQIYERGAAEQLGALRGVGDGVQPGEALAMTYGLVSSMKDAFRLSYKALKSGETGFALNKIDLPQQKAFTAEAFNMSSETAAGRTVDLLGEAFRVPGRLLGAEDEFFKTIGYRMELHAQALRTATAETIGNPALAKASPAEVKGAISDRIAQILADPPEHIKIASADAALYNTFSNKPGWFADAVLQLRNSGGAANPTFLVLPFVRTVANIARYSFERTPLAPLVGQWREDIAAGGARRDLAMARMSTGTMVMLTAADYADGGQISGRGPKDQGERESLIRQGWQPYSVKVGDRWYSYNRADPFGMTMGLAADINDSMKRGEIDEDDVDEWQEVMAMGIAAVSQVTVNKTYLRGLAEFNQMLFDPGRYSESYVEGFVGSFVPFASLTGAVETAVDPTARDVNSPGDAVFARIAGLSDKLQPKRDLWGREIKNESGLGAAYDFMSPVASRGVKDSPIDAEMSRLGMDVRRIGKKTSFDGVNVNLKDWPEVYSEYTRLAGNDLQHPAWGKGAYDFLSDVVGGKSEMSDLYKMKSDGKDGMKAAWIRDQIENYRQLAQKAILEDPKFSDFADFVGGRKAEKADKRMPVLQ